jgi:hypothetical protein
MGTDYYIHLVIGIKAELIVKEIIDKEFIQSKFCGEFAYTIDGKELGYWNQRTHFSMLGKEYESRCDINDYLSGFGLGIVMIDGGESLSEQDMVGKVYEANTQVAGRVYVSDGLNPDNLWKIALDDVWHKLKKLGVPEPIDVKIAPCLFISQ